VVHVRGGAASGPCECAALLHPAKWTVNHRMLASSCSAPWGQHVGVRDHDHNVPCLSSYMHMVDQ
jgi:hypothetical protein